MALDERYVLDGPLNEAFVDKTTGEALAAGVIYYYRDKARTTAKPIYELSGTEPNYTYTTVTNNPMTLSAAGTAQDAGNNNIAVYLKPYITDTNGNEVLDLYYIECYDSGGVLQWTREAWPNITAATDDTNRASPIENQLANPQFTRTFLNPGLATTLSFSMATNEEVDIAPDWKLRVSGSGDIVLTQTTIAGSENVITRPAYALDVNIPSGITKCELVQRLKVNSGLWTTDPSHETFLSGSLTVKHIDSGTKDVEMYYRESSGRYSDSGSDGPLLILTATAPSGAYATESGVSAQLEASDNTDTGDDAWAEVYLNFLSIPSNVVVTSAQTIPTYNIPDVIPYEERTSNREQALMGDYYIPELERSPIRSLLTGWDFPLNPYQFRDVASTFALTNANTLANAYIADQTIGAAATATGFTVGLNSSTGGLQFTSLAINEALTMIQYLEGAQVKKIIKNKLAVNVFAHKTTVGTSSVHVYLYRAGASDAIPTVETNILGTTTAATGVFVLDGYATGENWTEIARGGLPDATATIQNMTAASESSQLDSGKYDYKFSQWEMTSDTLINDTDKFAIVATFTAPTISTVLTIESISLVPGDIATRPSPQTKDEVLRECQYYYETSWATNKYITYGTPNAGPTGDVNWSWVWSSSNRTDGKCLASDFKVIKRKQPSFNEENVYGPFGGLQKSVSTVTYSASGAVVATDRGATLVEAQASLRGVYFLRGPSSYFPNGDVDAFHWEADARLGVVA